MAVRDRGGTSRRVQEGDNLDTELPLRAPGALEEVQGCHIDEAVAEVAAALRAAIEEARPQHHAVSWTPHGTDNQVLASALDLSDAMAAVAGRDLVWHHRDAAPLRRSGEPRCRGCRRRRHDRVRDHGRRHADPDAESTVNVSQPWGALAEE